MSVPLTWRDCMVNSRAGGVGSGVPTVHRAETGWMATLWRPIFQVKYRARRHSNLEPAMTKPSFTIFDTAIGSCGIAWGERGVVAVQLPMSNEEKTRKRIHQRFGDI